MDVWKKYCFGCILAILIISNAIIAQKTSTDPQEINQSIQEALGLLNIVNKTSQSSASECNKPGDKDVVVILDISGADRSVFQQQKKVLLELLEASKTDFGNIYLGLITFSDTPQVQIKLGRVKNQRKVKRIIRNIRTLPGDSGTAAAFELALLDLQLNGRPGAFPVFILFQNGLSSDRWPLTLKTSAKLKQAEVTVYSVTLNANSYMSELQAYASSPKLVYPPGRFEKFIEDYRELMRRPPKECQILLTSKNFKPGDVVLSFESSIKTDSEMNRLNDSSETDAQDTKCRISSGKDLFILLDTSGTTEKVFYEQKMTIATLLRDSFSHSASLRVGFIGFNESALLHFGLQQSLGSRDKIRYIMRMEQSGVSKKGMTSAVDAMFLALEGFENYGRPDAERVIILFSTNPSQNTQKEILETSELLKFSDVTVYAYVSSYKVSLLEMLEYADLYEDRVYTTSEKETFLKEMTSKLSTSSCLYNHTEYIPDLIMYQRDPCQTNKIDLIFLIDTSINSEIIFVKHREIVAEMIMNLSISETEYDVNVGVIAFNDTVETLIPLKMEATKTELLNVVSRLSFSHTNTRSVWGIRMAFKEFRIGGRPDALPAIVFFSDGNSQDSWRDVMRAGRKLKEYGIEVFAATYSTLSDKQELLEYASADTRVYLNQDIENGRLSQDFEKYINQTGCEHSSADIDVVEVVSSPNMDDSSAEQAALKPLDDDSEPDSVGTTGFCPLTETDVLIMVDNPPSDSVDRAEFMLIKVIDFLDASANSTDRVQFAIMDIRKKHNVVFDFGQPYTDAEELVGKLNLSKSKMGDTDLVKAIQRALIKLNSSKRKGANQVVIVFSDGHAKNTFQDLTDAGDYLRSWNQVFSVGYSPDAKLGALVLLSGSEDRVYLPEMSKKILHTHLSSFESNGMYSSCQY